jgi:hypothetical protein
LLCPQVADTVVAEVFTVTWVTVEVPDTVPLQGAPTVETLCSVQVPGWVTFSVYGLSEVVMAGWATPFRSGTNSQGAFPVNVTVRLTDPLDPLHITPLPESMAVGLGITVTVVQAESALGLQALPTDTQSCAVPLALELQLTFTSSLFPPVSVPKLDGLSVQPY